MSSQPTNISLYIHIPFCSKKCNYCDFYSISNSFELMDKIIENINLQFDKWVKYLGFPNIETVFIGGGTPSILPNKLLKRLLKKISDYASNIYEWTIEANPESITEEFLNTCTNFGVDRLSIGVQSFNELTLKVLGRNCSLEETLVGLELIKKKWNGRLSLDLITSIPGQTKEDVKKDIETVVSYNPEHISFYSLILEEGTKLEDLISKGEISELNVDEATNLWLIGREELIRSGYKNYEVSNYTKDKPSFHNQKYWELKPYLGLGPGAVSTLINHNGDIIRVHNKKSINEYIKGTEVDWGEELEVLDNKEFLKDYIMMGLRLKKGIDKKRFKAIFGEDIEKLVPISINLLDRQLVNISNTHFLLTDKGYDIMNSILVEILESLEEMEIKSVNWFY